MTSKRRKFSRRLGERPYRKIFVLAVEGKKTEPQYFGIFNNKSSVIQVKCLKANHGSAPPKVHKRMEIHLKKEKLKKTDEAWLVVDRDQWSDEQLNKLHEWSLQADNYGFALSNPKFEYWLLLHFEDGKGVTNSQGCSQKLNNYLPDYSKGIDVRKITDEMILGAIRRAKQRDTLGADWPQDIGTTVYKLVEKILGSHKNQ